jgi:hypothetical protein
MLWRTLAALLAVATGSETPWPIAVGDCHEQYAKTVAAGGREFFLNCWGSAEDYLLEIPAGVTRYPEHDLIKPEYDCGRPIANNEWCI